MLDWTMHWNRKQFSVKVKYLFRIDMTYWHFRRTWWLLQSLQSPGSSYWTDSVVETTLSESVSETPKQCRFSGREFRELENVFLLSQCFWYCEHWLVSGANHPPVYRPNQSSKALYNIIHDFQCLEVDYYWENLPIITWA